MSGIQSLVLAMLPRTVSDKNSTDCSTIIEYQATSDLGRYLLTLTVGYPGFCIPFFIFASDSARIILACAIIFFVLASCVERLFPNAILRQIAVLPMTCVGPFMWFLLVLPIIYAERMTPPIAAVAALCGGGALLVNLLIIRRLTPESSVAAAVNFSTTSLTKRGISVSPPWTSSLFVPFSRWENYLINTIRLLVCVVWAYGVLVQGPYVYTSVGIQERWPMAWALLGFPLAFFLSWFWYIPFLWHCQASPEPLIQKARRKSARATREAKLQAEQEAKDARGKRARSERS